MKALNAIGPRKGVQFTVFGPTRGARGPKLSKFSVKRIAGLDVPTPFDPRIVREIRSPEPAGRWVERAAIACRDGAYQAMVTAPLSKTSIVDAGLKDIGHTEILRRIANAPEPLMGFVGRHFAVVLATGHRALKDAVAGFDAAQLGRALELAEDLRATLPPDRRRRPVAVVGVNPHAGERGLIGREEEWMRACLPKDVAGPLVPDAAFLPKYWKSYSVYVCPYHDQGLIPFKLVHGFEGGVHLTLGLPFVRTSVDHGTAKELYGKNKAQAGSMKDAILAAIRLSQERSK